MNTKMLNAFLLFYKLKFSQVGFITYLLIPVKYGSMEAFKDTLPIVCNGYKVKI